MQEALTNGSHSVVAHYKSSPPIIVRWKQAPNGNLPTQLPASVSNSMLCWIDNGSGAHSWGPAWLATTCYYYSWVRSKSIKVGDTLVFNYDATKDYSVAEVTQFKFIACNASNAKFFDNSGTSSVTLTEPGQHYFMAQNHCLDDQMVFSVLV